MKLTKRPCTQNLLGWPQTDLYVTTGRLIFFHTEEFLKGYLEFLAAVVAVIAFSYMGQMLAIREVTILRDINVTDWGH